MNWYKQTLGVVLGVVSIFSANASEPREYPCYPLKQEPVLDGKIDDECWKEIPEAAGFYILREEEFAIEKPTVFKAGWTKDALFLAVTCFEDIPGKMKADGGGCWSDDSVEIFFVPPSAEKYFQLAANSGGVRSNIREGGDYELEMEKPWDWQVKAEVGQDRWILEMRIPFAVFQASPANETRWLFNMARNITTGPARERYTCWPPLKEGFNDLPNFAALVFRSKPVDQAGCLEAEQRINGAYRAWLDRTGKGMIQSISTNEELNQIFKNSNLQIEATPLHESMQKLERLLGEKTADNRQKAAVLKECLVRKRQLLQRAKSLGLIAAVNEEVKAGPKLAVTFEIKKRDADIKLLVNGKEFAPGRNAVKAELCESLNVLGIVAEAKGKNPGLKVEMTGYPEITGRWRWADKEESQWMSSGFDDKAWGLAKTNAEGYVWGTNGNAGKMVFRQIILWNAGHDGPQRCINPLVREWGFSEDSLETLFLTLYSPLPFALEDFEFVFDIPACFQMVGEQSGNDSGLNRKPLSVLKESAQHEERNYRRYRFFFPPGAATTNRTCGKLLPVQLGKYENISKSGKDNTCRFYFHRKARGNFTELQQNLPVRILPPINGKMPQKVFIQQYRGFTPPHYRHIAEDYLVSVMKQSMRAGLNCLMMMTGAWRPGGAGDELGTTEFDRLVYRMAVEGSVRVAIWPLWNHPLANSSPRAFDDDFFHWLETTPEARARYFEDSAKWTDTGYLGRFCPSYAVGGGSRSFRQMVKNDYAKMLALLPKAEIFWNDWESWPWVNTGNPYSGVPPSDGRKSWCFCDRCKQAFRTFAKLPASADLSDAAILKEYSKQWVEFRSNLDGRVQGEICRVCHELGCSYMIYSWTAHAEFWKACKGRVDLAFPGLPGNAPADSIRQKYLDTTMAFFRDNVGLKRVIGQRFSFFEDAGAEGWKNWMVLSKDGYVNARSWKPQIIRMVATLHGGVDLSSIMECCAGMQYYIGEATRIISEYEPLFWDGERADDLAQSEQVKYPNLLVLKRGEERLVLLFNETKEPLTVDLNNRELQPDQTAILHGSSLEFKSPEQMQVTVPPEDVAVVHIFPRQ